MIGPVLLVDDDEDTRDALAMILEAEGFVVAQATDGDEAVAMMRAGLRPSVVLLDLMMPRLNGADALVWMKHDPGTAGIPVIVLSGDMRGSDAAARAGADKFLHKPVELEAILGAVRNAITGACLH